MTPSFPILFSAVVASISLLLLSFFTIAINAEQSAQRPQLLVTHEDMNVVLRELHEEWPPRKLPPSSHISGLTNDDCHGSGECVPPRVCVNCASSACSCVKSPVYENFSCRSTMDCDEGEHCEWNPLVGITAGICISSLSNQGVKIPILSEPIESVPPLLGLGLTGDRCFSHKDCRGSRSCLGELSNESNLHNVTTCEDSLYACVCTPITFIPCSTTSDCPHQEEVCASMHLVLAPLFSYRHLQDAGEAQLEPICLSSNLTNSEYVIPVSTMSDTFNTLDVPAAKLQMQSLEPKKLPLPSDRIHLEMPPFSVPELSYFNTLTTNDLGNEFLGGILSLIIVSQLHKILQSFLYSVPGIRQKAYSSYIIYSRLSSLRHIWRTFVGHEPCSDMPVCWKRRRKDLSPKQFLLPLVALVVFFSAEVACIVAGADRRKEYYAQQNFDPIVAAVKDTPRPRTQDQSKQYCDDFLVPTRGLFKSGSVLKCVEPVSKTPEFEATDVIFIEVYFNSGRTILSIFSQNGTFAAVELSTFVRSEGGVKLRTMPFRPDLMNQFDQITFLNGVLNGIRARLGYVEEDIRRNVWSSHASRDQSGRLDSLRFGCRPNWNDSIETINDAVVRGLRDLDLVLNSTGQPWVYTMPHTFERVSPLMVIVRPYRIPHAWLTIAAVVVTALHVIVNSFVTHFDDVAYIAMKELMGDDCVLGPLAETHREPAPFEL